MTTFDVRNPATGEVIATIERDSLETIEEKIIAGERAFQTWKYTSAHERAALLTAWAARIESEKTVIAETMTKENGKPFKESLGEMDYAISYITWYAEEAKRIYGRTIPAHTPEKELIVSKQPIGLVGAITPWNFPAAMMTRKAAPALAAGCTFIIKPAEATPLTTIRLIELAYEAGIPRDVIQVVNGRGSLVGDIFTESKLIRKLTFTGSTAVGKKLMKASANTVKNVTMELGGHAPLIVTADADIELAAKEAVHATFRNAGQTCISVNRILVHESVHADFTEKFTEKTAKLIVGNGLDASTDIGPIINQTSFEKIRQHITDAIEKGATVLTGNILHNNEANQTYFIEPTILDGATENMLIMHEETFGPVVPITRFSTINEAITMANNTPFGLAAYFFTNDYRTGHELFNRLDYGIIGWNDGAPSAAHIPFGGMKESGLGREGATEGIEAYLETKLLSIGGHRALTGE